MKSWTWEEIANASEETKKLIVEEYGPLGEVFISMAPKMLQPAVCRSLTREDFDRVHREAIKNYMSRRSDLKYEGGGDVH